VSQTRLFVGNIPKDVSPSSVKEQLSKVMRGKEKISVYPTGDAGEKNRGFAFIDFEDHSSAKRGMDAVAGMKIGGRSLTSDWAEKEPEVDESIMKTVKKLYARNIPPGTNSSQLIHWLDCDQITHCKIMGNYAFVHFHSRQAAQGVLMEKNGQSFKDHEIELTWAKPAGHKRCATSPIFLQSPLLPLTLNTNPSVTLPPFSTPLPFSNALLPLRHPSLLTPSIDILLDSSFLDRIASTFSPYSLFYYTPQSPVVLLSQRLSSKNLPNVIFQSTVTLYQNVRHFTTQAVLPTGKTLSSLPCLSPLDSISLAAQLSLLSLLEDGVILPSEVSFSIPSIPLTQSV
ncbi:hypothetical protein PMAYCL1PPCAC_18273, partial [Pristionchus mayeri]